MDDGAPQPPPAPQRVAKLRAYMLDPFVKELAAWIGAAITMLITAFGFYRGYVLEELDKAKELTKVADERLEKEVAAKESLKKRLDDQTRLYDQLLAWQRIPFLRSPASAATIIGTQIRFEWAYSQQLEGPDGNVATVTSHNFPQRFQLRIRLMSGQARAQELTFPVPQADPPSMHISVSDLPGPGVYLWRVVPTQLQDDRDIAFEDSSSRSSTFEVFHTTYDRICQMQEMRVGTSPALIGRLHRFLAIERTIAGYDIGLAKEVAIELARRLNQKARQKGVACALPEDGSILKIVQLPFGELLPSLKQRKIDFVISSMTATKGRELEHRGVRFSDAYLTVHQIVISAQPCPKKGEMPRALEGRRVGVSGKSTNEQAALHLQKSWHFALDVRESFNGLYEALEQNEIDFAIVDDLVALEYLRQGNQKGTSSAHRFERCGDPLDPHLGAWYKQELQKPDEHYAIAVMLDPAIEIESSLLEKQMVDVVNDMLADFRQRGVLTRLQDECMGSEWAEKCAM